MKFLYAVIPLAILAGGWYLLNSKQATDLVPGTESSTFAPQIPEGTDQTPNPLATHTPDETKLSSADRTIHSTVDKVTSAPPLPPRPTRDDIDLTTLAAAPLSDTQFNDLQNRIRLDPGLLSDILTEYRYNTDPERAKRLAALIGKLKDPNILSTATELAYAGDFQSKINGLELLSRIQPHNSEARDITIELLGSETDPEFLVATMNTLATPGSDATQRQKQLLMDNLIVLSTHPEPSVRAHSISLLGRWSRDDLSSTSSLTVGLSDSSPHVRARAANALIGVNNPNPQMIAGLFAILEDTGEAKSTRQTAMLALQRMQLSQPQQTRFLDGQRALRTRQITQ